MPFALSQLVQSPRFPVVNTSIGADGQNMLVTQHAPVLHLVSMGRPVTWGYFFLGARRGLAWSWWFQPFACFTALMLLLEIVLRGRWKLAAFGAFLFCSSAYVVCWSQWPAYMVMFAAVVCLSAYHLLASRRRAVLVASAILLGVAIAGFVTDLYPPVAGPDRRTGVRLPVRRAGRARSRCSVDSPSRGACGSCWRRRDPHGRRRGVRLVAGLRGGPARDGADQLPRPPRLARRRPVVRVAVPRDVQPLHPVRVVQAAQERERGELVLLLLPRGVRAALLVARGAAPLRTGGLVPDAATSWSC